MYIVLDVFKQLLGLPVIKDSYSHEFDKCTSHVGNIF